MPSRTSTRQLGPSLALALALASPIELAGPVARAAPSRPPPSNAAAAGALQGSPIDGAAQLVVVTSAAFSSTTGTLVRLERRGAAWARVGVPVAVSVGRGGMGWGRGRFPAADEEPPPGPVKREGDKRAPAGIFSFAQVTGYAPAPPMGLALPYRQATAALRCVDDPSSADYNALAVAPEGRPAPWSSDERMRRDDGLYELTLQVDHNRAPVVRGAGSCIFLHVGASPARPTVGCTAMSLGELRALLIFLDPAKRPLLVQMPATAYRALRRRLGLPRL